MFEFVNIFIFVNFLQVIKAPEPDVLVNLLVTKEEAENALAEIEPNQVLPLVLFREYPDTVNSQPMFEVLQIPKDLIHVMVQDRRMVKGTLFLNLSQTQMFFCPKQNVEKKCLAPHEFTGLQYLECPEEPIPIVVLDSKKDACGSEKNGTLHNIVYEICPMELPFEYETKEISFYGFCYDTIKKNTIYTSHIISSPYLLKSHLLIRERNVKYSIKINNEFKPSTLNEIEVAKIPEWRSFIHPPKSDYKLQMLVPDADMALALWKKTTYQNFNLDWQHVKLIPLWDQINDDIRSYASKLITENIKLRVHTGIINTKSVSEDNSQMSNMWVKIITTVPSNAVKTPRGISIFMNNFIGAPKNADDSTTISNPAEEALKKFCQDDFCAYTLREKFNQVGGTIRCCRLKYNQEIRNVFGEIKDLNTDGEFHTLQIPGVSNKLSKFPHQIQS